MTSTSLHFPLLPPKDFATATRTRLDRLTEELATGRASDTGRALSNDFSAFSRVSHDLRTLQSREDALTRASTWMNGAQLSLEMVGTAGSRLAEGLVAGLTATGPGGLAGLAQTGAGALSDIVGALSRTDGGRSIFANGDASGVPPYDLDTLRAETRILAQSATDVSSLLQAFDDYFAPGGGVEAGALATSPTDPVRFPLGRGEALAVPVQGGDPEIREMVKQAALLAALPEAGFQLSAADRQSLASELPRRSVFAAAELATLRGRVGSVEARASQLSDRLTTERTQLEGRRTDAVGTDPFEIANRLQSEMSRLETIYAVTARRSRLNLTDFLR